MNHLKRAIELFNFDRQPPLAVEKATNINTVEEVVDMINQHLIYLDFSFKIDRKQQEKLKFSEKFCKLFAFLSKVNLLLGTGLLIYGAMNYAVDYFGLLPYGKTTWLVIMTCPSQIKGPSIKYVTSHIFPGSQETFDVFMKLLNRF